MKKSIFSLVLLVAIMILPLSLSAAGKDLKRMNPMEMQKVIEKELYHNLHLTANQRGMLNSIPNPFMALVTPPMPRVGYGNPQMDFGPKPAPRPMLDPVQFHKMKARYLDNVERVLTVKQYKQLVKNMSSLEKKLGIAQVKPVSQPRPNVVPARPKGRG